MLVERLCRNYTAAGLFLCFFLISLSSAQDPFAVATFHCPGLYWSPADGSADTDVLVLFEDKSSAFTCKRCGYIIKNRQNSPGA